jgi:hypothetical protein
MAAEQLSPERGRAVVRVDAAEAVPASHAGRLVLDQTSATTWVLTDTATQESKPLPVVDGSWTLAIHETTGRAVVFSFGGEAEDVIVVDDFMQKQLFQQPGTDELVLVEPRPGNPCRQQLLAAYKSKYREGLVTINSDLNTKVELSVFVFVRPRCTNCRIFVDITCLYKLLGLSQYNGQATKWFYNLGPKWCRRLSAFLGDGHCGHSHGALDNDLEEHEKCLPRPCFMISCSCQSHAS